MGVPPLIPFYSSSSVSAATVTGPLVSLPWR